VHGFFVGEEVFGFVASGSYAEFIVVKAELTVHKPKRLSWEAAAVLPSVGLTAVSALDQLQIKKGETLLLHAAAGGVGTVATQLAVARGARVIGTCGEHNRDYLRSLGAVPVLYGEGLEERVRELGEVDAALDCVGGEAIDVSLKLVKDRQRIGTITSPFLIESTGIRWIDCVKDAKTLEFLAETEIQLPIAKSFPLAEAAAAHRLSEGGHVRGKLVLTIE
jgi:enoyl reductase